jgi:magnesium transporter
MLAKVIGGILPLLAKSVNLDPAIMASPLISTMVDALTLLSYFKIAEIIMGV